MSFLDLYQNDAAQAARIQPTEGARAPSGFDENFSAAWNDGRLFGQSIASQNARAGAISDYMDEVRQKAGIDLNEQIYPNGGEGGAPPDYDAANARIAAAKEKNPSLQIDPINEDEVNKRALAKSQAAHRTYQELQAGEKAPFGGLGSFLGSTASSAADPINIVSLAIAPEAQGASILASALKWGALAGVSQAAIEASSSGFKEQVQPGYAESGEAAGNVAGAFAGGALLGGATKALGNAWTRVKTGSWPTSVRDAGNVLESEAQIKATNIFPGAEGEVAHREALGKAIDDVTAGRPVDVSQHITPDLLERSQALTERMQAEQPMRLPIINQRAIELAAEQERLGTRDTELATALEKLPPGDATAADRLNRLQAVEQQIAETTDPAALKKLNERKDQILVDTNPETLQAAAAPIEARRAAEAERANIAARMQDIQHEHAQLQSDYSLLGQIRLPAVGESQRLPKGQLELPLEAPPAEPVAAAPVGPQPAMHHPEEMAKTLAAPDHQDAIRADIDRARMLGDVKVPGVDENGNHTMVSVDAGMDQVDAYKAAAEQIQACAAPQAEEEAQ